MIKENIEIIPLPKEQWKGTPIPLVTKTDSYYDLEISPLDKDGCKINLIKKPLIVKDRKVFDNTGKSLDFGDAYPITTESGKMMITKKFISAWM